MKFFDKLEGFFSRNVETFAIKNWKPYRVKKEWLSVIIVLVFVKLGTNAVSIFSGYQFLKNSFFALLNDATAAALFTVVALLLIELLGSLMLAKFFKFALRLDFANCILPTIIAIAVMYISCSISCRGIAIYAADTADLSQDINYKYNSNIEALRADYNAECDIIKNQIRTIEANPEEWKDGKRCVLSRAQNIQLNLCYDKLTLLKKELNEATSAQKAEQAKELQENDAHTINEADKFYKYVAVIMAVQILSTGLLWFFWAWIAKEEAPEIDQKETIKRIYDHADKLLDNGFNTCLNTKFSILQTAFALLNSDLQAKNNDAAKAMQQTTDPQPQPSRLGFAAAADSNLQPSGTLKIYPVAPAETAPQITLKTEGPEQQHSDTCGPVVTAPEPTAETAPTTAPTAAAETALTTATTAHTTTPAAAVSGYLGVTTCKHCGKEFIKRSWNNYYCCKQCKDDFWAAQGLNIETIKKRNAKL